MAEKNRRYPIPSRKTEGLSAYAPPILNLQVRNICELLAVQGCLDAAVAQSRRCDTEVDYRAPSTLPDENRLQLRIDPGLRRGEVQDRYAVFQNEFFFTEIVASNTVQPLQHLHFAENGNTK